MDDVIELHDALIERTGGLSGFLNRGAIRSAIVRAQYGPFLSSGTLAERGALVLRGITQDHPFLDGNKRTAWSTTEVFLRRNGAHLEASDEEALNLVLSTARGELTLEELTRWLRSHLRRR